MNTIHVTASSSYDVLVGAGLLDKAGEYAAALTHAACAAVVSDDTVFPLYGETVCQSLRAAGLRVVSFVFPHGERSKNIGTFSQILNFLAENRLARTDLVVALGGGVVGDVTGFASACYLRGVAYIQIPTTLLAAVDSSVGGKTAIDLPAGKNLAGSFYQPRLVLCDTDTLASLPDGIFADGCAEVVKYAMYGNAPFFEELSQNGVKKQLSHVISTCVCMKRDVVCADEFDRGGRQILNFGHTFGHAVERCSDYTVPHGSAVAIGMVMISRAAVKRGLCGASVLDALLALLRALGLPTETAFSASELLDAACRDKKIAGGRLNLIVPRAVGRCEIMPIDTAGLSAWLRDGGAK